MNRVSIPEMSVVLVTPDRWETIRRTVRHLQRQSASGRLELVVVTPALDRLAADPADQVGFHSVQLIETPMTGSTAVGRAAGIRAAIAPIVALVEDHSFPAPGWAEALLAAHDGPWAAVGPVMRNGNPATMVSWAHFLPEYAEWLDPAPGGVVKHLPGHNCSYKRALLLEYEPRLVEMLEAESVLHWDLQARGHQLFLEPRARTYHLNMSRLSTLFLIRFDGGRLFAGARCRDWPMIKRMLYTAGAPLIPLIRLRRIVRELWRPGRPHHLLPRILPTLVLTLILDGLGEMAGYAFGSGDAINRLYALEFHRDRYMIEHETQVAIS